MRGPQITQLAREICQGLLRGQRHNAAQMRIVRDEGRHRLLGDEKQLGVGMTVFQRAQQRSGQENVAN